MLSVYWLVVVINHLVMGIFANTNSIQSYVHDPLPDIGNARFTSELLESPREMFPSYYMHGDFSTGSNRFKSTQ